MNEITKSKTIGVKSKGQIDVGKYFLINSYIGSIISARNLGRIFNQNILTQESITSAKIKYCIISSRI